MITTRILTALLFALAMGIGAVAAAGESERRSAESRAAVKQFAGRLQAELKQAITESGPVGAIEVCRIAAPAIAIERSRAEGWKVARTSLRTRNPDNAPDEWETKVLNLFETRKANGEDPAKMEHSEIVVEGYQQTFRYMKAIPTKQLCLNCHGGDLAPDVAATLKELYPSDQATGFKVGDIRGAFTITRPM